MSCCCQLFLVTFCKVDETGQHYHNWREFCRHAKHKGERIFTSVREDTNNLYIRLAQLAIDHPEIASLQPPHRFWTQFANHAERLIAVLRETIEAQVAFGAIHGFHVALR